MNENKNKTHEDYEEEFKNMVFKAFSEKIPGVHRDDDGFIVVPMVRRRKKTITDKKES